MPSSWTRRITLSIFLIVFLLPGPIQPQSDLVLAAIRTQISLLTKYEPAFHQNLARLRAKSSGQTALIRLLSDVLPTDATFLKSASDNFDRWMLNLASFFAKLGVTLSGTSWEQLKADLKAAAVGSKDPSPSPIVFGAEFTEDETIEALLPDTELNERPWEFQHADGVYLASYAAVLGRIVRCIEEGCLEANLSFDPIGQQIEAAKVERNLAAMRILFNKALLERINLEPDAGVQGAPLGQAIVSWFRKGPAVVPGAAPGVPEAPKGPAAVPGVQQDPTAVQNPVIDPGNGQNSSKGSTASRLLEHVSNHKLPYGLLVGGVFAYNSYAYLNQLWPFNPTDDNQTAPGQEPSNNGTSDKTTDGDSSWKRLFRWGGVLLIVAGLTLCWWWVCEPCADSDEYDDDEGDEEEDKKIRKDKKGKSQREKSKKRSKQKTGKADKKSNVKGDKLNVAKKSSKQCGKKSSKKSSKRGQQPTLSLQASSGGVAQSDPTPVAPNKTKNITSVAPSGRPGSPRVEHKTLLFTSAVSPTVTSQSTSTMSTLSTSLA